MRSTHTIKESILKTSTSESTKTDGELARELQAQFDLEVRQRFPIMEKTIDDDDNFAIKMVQEYALRPSSHSKSSTPTPDASIPERASDRFQ